MSPLTEEPSNMSLAPSSTTSGEFCPGPTTPSEVLAPSAMSAAAEDPEKVLSTTDQPVTEDAEEGSRQHPGSGAIDKPVAADDNPVGIEDRHAVAATAAAGFASTITPATGSAGRPKHEVIVLHA